MTFRRFHLGAEEYKDALRLREDVLRKPLGLLLTTEELAHEASFFHLGGFDGNCLRAVLFLQPFKERTVKMRQVAVAPGFQKCGIGSRLIMFAEAFARENGFGTIFAHARLTAVGFYERLGYTVSPGEFVEMTIPHCLVTKAL